MKKKLAFLLAVITLLTVTGCQPVHTPGESTAASETAPSDATEPLTDPTQPSTDPTTTVTYSTDPPEGIPKGFPYSTSYVYPPDEFRTFIYNGPNYSYFFYNEVDTSKCLLGKLYLYNYKTGKLRMFPDEPATSHTTTLEYIYYVTEAEPDTIYRSDYTGENRELVFRAGGGKYLCLDSFRFIDGKGVITIIINDKQAALYHLEEQKLDILMEQAYIKRFGFEHENDPYRLMLCWHGRVSEDEEGIHSYLTYLDTGETVDWNYL